MHIYDFEKNKKKVKHELDIRLKENKQKLDEILRINKIEYNLNINMAEDEVKEVYDIENLESRFMNIRNKIIGIKNLDSKLIYKPICNKKIMYNKFIDCNFNRVKFENCIFYGAIFENCKFNNVIFSYCDFHEKDGLIGTFEKNCIFENCVFDNTDLKHIVFSSNEFEKIKFTFSNLRNVIFDKCKINRILFCDCNLKSMKIIDTDINVLRFEDTYLSKVDENTFIDKFEIHSKENYENILKNYKSISAIYESNRLFNYSGEYYYFAKCMERKSLIGMERIKSKIFWAICGYGERPTFALITSFEIVLIFAIIYMFSGLSINGTIINYSLNIFQYLPKRAIYVDFIRCIYFSLVTFTSVGYGDIFPIGYSVIFSCFEMILGVTMVGVWTATLARKITR